MVNHLTNDSDVTAGYIILLAEKKMDAEQRMADAIDRLLTPPAEGNVIPIGASKNARKGGNHLGIGDECPVNCAGNARLNESRP